MVYVRRDLETELARLLKTKEIIAVVGPRQCGKTTLLQHFLSGLKKVNALSFDDIKQRELFENDIDSFIELNVKGYDYLFIDEVQYVKEGGRQLKYLYDTQNIKILLSGSSAPEISIQSLQYLVGRIFILKLYPFSFREFVRAKDAKLETVYAKGEYGEQILARLNALLDEYLLYGSYPRVVLANDVEEKQTVLRNLFNTYLLREIKEILGLTQSEKLLTLLKALSLQIGNLLNYSELSNLTGFSYAELKQYLTILENTFVISLVRPYYTNKRTELVKTPKVYFIDMGFRNSCIDNFALERTDLGAMHENSVFAECHKQGNKLHYWRTKSGAEVDFILNDKTPVEVKQVLREAKLTRSFRSFLQTYKPDEAYVVSRNFSGERDGVRFLPIVTFLQHERSV